MSKSKSDRQKAANAIARLRRDSTPVTGPREPKSPLPRREMLCGGEFVEWDALADARLRLSNLPLDRLPLRCRRTVDAALQDTSVRTIRRARAQLFEVSASQNVDAWISQACARVEEMLAFNLAGLGDHRAAAEVSAAALCQWMNLLTVGQFGEAFLCLRTAIVWAGDAQFSHTDTWKYPDPTYPRLHALEINPDRMMAFSQALADADAQLRVADDILRGGAGMMAPPVEGGDLALDFLGDGVAYPTPEEIAEPAAAASHAAPAGQTLVVFPEMGHLPVPSTSIRDRGDSPRALAEPWAGKPMPLTQAPDPRAFAEGLWARFPWAGEAIDAYAADLVGAPYARVSPRILVGPAGCGKTAFARAILEAAGLDVTVYAAAGQMDGGSFAGTSRQWGTWRPSVPAQACLRLGKASHGIVVDEVEKAGTSRRWGRLDETLLPFLERGSTARAIFDPAFEIALDLSAVSLVLTANSLDGLAGPLRDRCQVLTWPAPRAEDLPVVAASILEDLRRERGLAEAWCPALDGEELDALSAWRGGSLRPLRRMIEIVLAARETLAPRH